MQTQMSVVASARPRFRQDLVAELVEEQGNRFVDVADPDTGSLFRFFEVEYSLACAMDGERDVAGIVKWAQEELGITPSPDEVKMVISTLSDMRFIDTGDLVDGKAAKAASQAELAPGVVVGKPNQKQVADVELGKAGPPASVAAKENLPAADFALGAPGAAPVKTPAKPPADNIALGTAGSREAKKPAAQPDVSLDLADQFGIKPGDVKEAVRQSKVMSAVEVPKELVEAEATKPVAARHVAKQPEPTKQPVAAKHPEPMKQPVAAKHPEPMKQPVAEKHPEPMKQPVAAKQPEPVKQREPAKQPVVARQPEPARQPVVAKQPERAKQPEKRPVELPKQPVAERVEKYPTAPPTSSGVSPILISILILVVIGAGAFFVWKFLLDKPEEAPQTSLKPKAPPAPPKPTEITSKIAMETPPSQEVKATAAGTIETIEAADKDVQAGDMVATLVGGKPLQTELANIATEIERLTPPVTDAEKELSDAQQKENNQAGVTAAQEKVDRVKKPLTDKKAAQTAKQAELDKLTIKATGDGKLADVVKVGDKVAADQVIAKIARPTAPVATFKLPAGTKIAADGTLSINAGGKTVVCTVSDAQAESVKVTCPADAGLANGADVKFTLPK